LSSVLFNIHDVALLLRLGQCALLAVLFFVHRSSRPASNTLLAVFLLLNAMIAFHVLALWGEAFRFLAYKYTPYLFFVFEVAYFLEGPILLWYTRSLIFKDFRLRMPDLVHLIPAALTPFVLYALYFRHPYAVREEIALNFENYGLIEPGFDWVIHPEKAIVVVYGFLCLYQIITYRRHLRQNYSNTEQIDLAWLMLLIGGFLASWMCLLAAHLLGLAGFAQPATAIAIAANYVTLILLNVLIFYALLYNGVFEGLSQGQTEQDRSEDDEKIAQYVEPVLRGIADEKLYLNPKLTLEEFSARIALPQRIVSRTINSHLNQNFHEFVNRYRVDEAKRALLATGEQEMAINEIAEASGFNSKPAFNRFFKKFTGMTPTEYRKQGKPTSIGPGTTLRRT